jgi:hypothetical protein
VSLVLRREEEADILEAFVTSAAIGRLASVAPSKSRWRRRELAALVVVVAMCACQDLREANEDAIRTESAIKSEVGSDAHVQYRTMLTPSGRQAVVVVKRTFEETLNQVWLTS